MSESIELCLSSKDFNSESVEMNFREETRSKADELGEEIIPDILPTQTTCFIDEIEIKHEEMDFHRNTSTSSDASVDSEVRTVSSIAHVDCDSAKAEEKDLNDFYLDLLRCGRDCETCQKYMKILSDHVRTTHAPAQSIQDPLLVDPLHIYPDPHMAEHSLSSIFVKCEVDKAIQRMEYSEERSKTNSDDECEPEFELESESMYENDPDYNPSTHVTQKVRPKGSIKNHASSDSRLLLKAKRRNLPTREQEQYDCHECGKSFKRMTDLDIHTRIHTGEKPFKCEECGKSFSTSIYLKRHKKTHIIHTGEKPFKCDVCKKSFALKRVLFSHTKSHTGEKPHTCDVCEKSFLKSSHLTDHKRIHTGEKPFKCSVCERAFTHKKSLTEHKRVHTGERPYACYECKKGYKTLSRLNAHKTIHTGEN